MQAQMKAITAAHGSKQYPECLAQLDDFSESLRAHLQKQFGDELPTEESGFPPPPPSCLRVRCSHHIAEFRVTSCFSPTHVPCCVLQQGKFKGAYHIAMMAKLQAECLLALAQNSSSVSRLLTFCQNQLGKWSRLVDIRASKSSMQVR